VTPHYDSLLGKLVCWGATRAEAVARTRQALEQLAVLGPRTNVEFLRAVVSHPRFLEGRLSTSFLDEEFAARWQPPPPAPRPRRPWPPVRGCSPGRRREGRRTRALAWTSLSNWRHLGEARR